ncbi:DUF6191 domain-containing protein [Streptomyces sp. NBC_01497]|uniref:DUF6191 domain-containing protein n=1 Tax=Streptomyces sp. NBC_01497 TaxID=2903885 RepID=UPI003FCE2A55
MIEDLFAPGRKHTAEEQKRLEMSRVDVDGSDPGRGPIDLASGKVTIRVGQAEAGQETGETAEGGADPDEGTAAREASAAPETAKDPAGRAEPES